MKPGRLLTLMLGAVLALAGGCSVSTAPSQIAASASSTPTGAAPADDDGLDLPAASRISDGGGGPRPVDYWAVWNSCAPENRAPEAAANGGRPAGFVLVDDLLADPGIEIGDYRVRSCDAALALLVDDRGEAFGVDRLAAELLTAELNLSVGAETCAAAEEAVLGAHLSLSAARFDEAGVHASAMPTDVASAIPRLILLLETYNRGDLCN